MNDTELFVRCWTGAYPMIAAYVSSVVPDFHRAEDILQQVAVVLVRKFHEYDRSQCFGNWAVGVARYEVLKYLRQNSKERHVFDNNLVEEIAVAFQQVGDELDSRQWALAECLKKVGDRGRQALNLRYVEGMKPAAVALRMGMSSNAMRVLLHRIRDSLRDCMQRLFATERKK